MRVAIITGASQGSGAGLVLERNTFVTSEILHVDGGQAAGH